MSDEKHTVEALVPQYLHRPFQLLFWESDELALIIIMFTLAYLGSSWFLWVLFVAVNYTYSRFKKSYPRGFLRHMLYSFGFIRLKAYPNADVVMYHE